MRVLAIIPARGGSKGIPGKNKKLLLGQPLISYTIRAALKSKLTEIVVSTDDDEIMKIAKSQKVKVVERPKSLGNDLTPTLPVLIHALSEVDQEYDAVMTLQPTSPLRTYKHINEAIDKFSDNPIADSLVSVVRVPHNYSCDSQMRLGANGLIVYQDNLVLRRQDKETRFARNGAAIYLTRSNKINEYIFGGNILAYEMGKTHSFDIDDMEDWEVVEALMRMRENFYE